MKERKENRIMKRVARRAGEHLASRASEGNETASRGEKTVKYLAVSAGNLEVSRQELEVSRQELEVFRQDREVFWPVLPLLEGFNRLIYISFDLNRRPRGRHEIDVSFKI